MLGEFFLKQEQARIQTSFHRFTEIDQIFISNISNKLALMK